MVTLTEAEATSTRLRSLLQCRGIVPPPVARGIITPLIALRGMVPLPIAPLRGTVPSSIAPPPIALLQLTKVSLELVNVGTGLNEVGGQVILLRFLSKQGLSCHPVQPLVIMPVEALVQDIHRLFFVGNLLIYPGKNTEGKNKISRKKNLLGKTLPKNKEAALRR